jgi:uncharacterized phage-associated protein
MTTPKTYSSKAVANYFLERAKQEGISLTPMQLIKLVYFAHGWCLAIFDRPLIDEQVQAWQFGPVIPSLYHEFKIFGNQPVTEEATKIELLAGKRLRFTAPNIPQDDSETRALLGKVWQVYSKLSALKLSRLTHQPNSPWHAVYNQHPGVKGLTIPDEDLKVYFKNLADTP